MTTVNSIGQKSDRSVQHSQLTGFRTLALCLALTVVAAGNSTAGSLRTGDILVTDSFGGVLRADPATGSLVPLWVGGNLVRPFGITTDASGNILVSDTGSLAIIRINPHTGKQTVITSGGIMGVPYGIDVAPNGDIIVANAQTIIRVNSKTHQQTNAALPGLIAPIGVAVAANGDIFVTDAGARAVVKVDAVTGACVPVCSPAQFSNPCGIVIDASGDLLVTDTGTHEVIRLNPVTGCTEPVTSWSGMFVTPVGIAVGGNGEVVVGDPDAAGLAGVVIGLDTSSNAQAAISTGSGNFVNPRGVTIVP